MKPIKPVRSILVATDFSAVSREGILPAYGLLAAGGGRVELCHVHVRERRDDLMDLSLIPPLTDTERVEVESKLRGLVPPDAAALGISTSISILEGSSVEETLLHAVERLNVDLIALASHGRSGIKRIVVGSVAEEIARRASKPVMIIHPGTDS